MVGVLIGKGADTITESVLALAMQKGNMETVKTLVNLNVPHDVKNENGETPLFIAV